MTHDCGQTIDYKSVLYKGNLQTRVKNHLIRMFVIVLYKFLCDMILP